MDGIMAEAANEKTVENPSSEQELLAALARETNTCKRQELLKALWRLGRDNRAEPSQSSAVKKRAPVGPTTHDRNSINHCRPDASILLID
jgi:hypothetical protein